MKRFYEVLAALNALCAAVVNATEPGNALVFGLVGVIMALLAVAERREGK